MHAHLCDAAPIVAHALGVRVGRIGRSVVGLRRLGRFPSNQGVAVPLSSRDIALVILAALVGPRADRVAAYAAVAAPGGQTLVDALAMTIDRPALLERGLVDLDEPAAMMTLAAGPTRYFGPPGRNARVAIIDGDAIAAIVADLQKCPARESGRPSNRDMKWI